MYNDLLLSRMAAMTDEATDEARIDHLIDEIDALDNLLSPEAQALVRDLRQHTVSEDPVWEYEEHATLAQRLADRIAEVAGSWGFIIGFLMFMVVWMALNVALGPRAFDTFPFILLNLGLSTLAALQAPVILMSQNRQAAKDRAMSENDFRVNLKSEAEITDLHRKMDAMLGVIEHQNRLVNVQVSARRQEVSATVQAIQAQRPAMLVQDGTPEAQY